MITFLNLPYKNEVERLKYYDWIMMTGISCMWDYCKHKGVDYMRLELDEEDAVALKLAFKI